MERSRRSIRKTDRILAAAIWIFTGLLAGFALSVFTDSGYFLAFGLLLGLFVAYRQDRATKQRHREQDEA